MVVLKKLKSSTLMETLVATVLIVIVFMVSSLIMNNLFGVHQKSNKMEIRAHLMELQYKFCNSKLELPYHGDYGKWEVSFVANNKSLIWEGKAVNKETKKEIYQKFVPCK
jgi:hypothetical protein